ncbi:MAG: hypothetical protein OHK0038_26380 [Flammeovirgaceae bacterium]
MAKLKNIIKQLSEKDYEAIYQSLVESSAEKSAYLLKAMREKSYSDTKIMEELDVNTNAYYTLRSRLNQKIEEYLLQQMESPRTELLKKVANIAEVIFTKKKAIAITTLKKLEKELIDYDLSNELNIIYKALKKLHINSEEYFQYSQLYNKNVAYMLAIDKAEDLLAEYFKKFASFSLTGDETEKLGLIYLSNEMDNICNLYKSHRLKVYQSCLDIYHRLFVENTENMNDKKAPIEDILDEVETTFENYHLDSIYHHLTLVFEFLRLEYYNFYKVYRKAEKHFEQVNSAISHLLSFYGTFTFPSQFLKTKLERHLRLNCENELYNENESLFANFECDKQDTPSFVNYYTYRALSCYYVGKYEEAAKWINVLLNEASLKNYSYALLEIKCLLALQYCCMKDMELFGQLVNSIQRQIRILSKDSCEDIVMFIKMLKTSINENKRDKPIKLRFLMDKFKSLPTTRQFSPIRLVRFDETFIARVNQS